MPVHAGHRQGSQAAKQKVVANSESAAEKKPKTASLRIRVEEDDTNSTTMAEFIDASRS